MNWLSFILGAGIGLGVYSAFLEPRRLVSRIHKLGDSGIKVVHFTDVHLGKFYSAMQLIKLVDKINAEKPDVVLFTGDLLDKSLPEYNVGAILNKIEGLKFAVRGNHDIYTNPIVYAFHMQNGGFQLLKNESVEIEVRGEKFTIVGIDDNLWGTANYGWAFDEVKGGRILTLCHEGDLIDNFPEVDGYHFVFSGHTHGGQVWLPKNPMLPKLGKKYVKGEYQVGSSRKLFVSSGVGSTGIRFRLLNSPEIRVYEF